METVLEIVEDEDNRFVNTVEIEGEKVEKEETQLADNLNSKLQTLPPFRTKGCICRVPYELRRVNEEAYTPMLVSIGPFHHGKESLQEMDVQKLRYLNDFQKRRPDLDLEYCVRTLKAFEERARNCYAENIHYSSEDFIKMMLLDGRFIVEFFLKYGKLEKNQNDDPIFKNYVMISSILRDMILLENQLPFFILKHLFNLIVGKERHGGIYFLGVAINNLKILMDRSDNCIPLTETSEANHMVDLYLQYYIATRRELPPETAGGIIRIPNASKLHESGVKFTKRTSSSVKFLLDVKFTIGNLEISSVMFADNTEIFCGISLPGNNVTFTILNFSLNAYV